MFFFGLFVGKNLKERKKRVKKLQSIFTKSLHYFSRKKGDAPQYTDTYRYTHKSPFSSAQKSASRRVERKKKAPRDDASRRRRPRRLSSSRVSRGGPLRRRERRGRGEKKSNIFVFCFFSPFSYFLCLPGGKKYDDARRRPKKSKKVKEERALCHQSHEDRDGRPRRERKDPKGGKVKEAPTEGVGEDQKRGGLPREREKGRPKKERTHNQKGFVFGTTF